VFFVAQAIPKVFLKIPYEQQFEDKGRVKPWQ
jgi:hypothetical protein